MTAEPMNLKELKKCNPYWKQGWQDNKPKEEAMLAAMAYDKAIDDVMLLLLRHLEEARKKMEHNIGHGVAVIKLKELLGYFIKDDEK